jgi:hypothetical protein
VQDLSLHTWRHVQFGFFHGDNDILICFAAALSYLEYQKGRLQG